MGTSAWSAPEVYPAMEEDALVSLQEPTRPAPIPAVESAAPLKHPLKRISKKSVRTKKRASKKLTLRQRIDVLEKEVATLRSRETGPAPLSGTQTFDTVPPEQAPRIAERLKIVELIILRYGRAYDYRQMTLQELRATLAQLEEE